MKKNNRAFTVIELLVVIAIIGLLSSLIVINLKNAKERAEQKKAMAFAHTVRVSLGSDLVGEWRFDEGADNTCPDGKDVCDSSGNDNHGTRQGSSLESDFWTNGIIRKAGQFNGIDDYVDIAISLQPEYEYVIAVWIYPESSTGLIVKRAHCDGLTMNGTNIGLSVKRADHSSGSFSKSLDYIQMNKWNFIAGIVNLHTRKISLFINGECFEATMSIGDDVKLMAAGGDSIGKGTGWDSNCPSGTAFNGFIDEVQIYNRALTTAEIQKHYAAGATKHGITLK